MRKPNATGSIFGGQKGQSSMPRAGRYWKRTALPLHREIAVSRLFADHPRGGQKICGDGNSADRTYLLLLMQRAYHANQPPDGGYGLHYTTPLNAFARSEITKVLSSPWRRTTQVLEAASLKDDLKRAGIDLGLDHQYQCCGRPLPIVFAASESAMNFEK